MRLPIVAGVALLVLGLLGWYGGYAREVQGELRCEGEGVSSSMLMARTMRSMAWRVALSSNRAHLEQRYSPRSKH